MSEFVSSEIAIPSEGLATLFASMWLQVSMCQEVSLEIGSLIEGTIAKMTLVRTLFHV